MELARRLFQYFGFEPSHYHQTLSKGRTSTFNMIVGLASRCSLTILDEPTTGMDEAVRKDFYRALMKDYLAHPRTILISSHHLNEIEDILEDVLLIKNGKTLLHESISDLKEWAIALQGASTVVQKWLEERNCIFQRQVGKDTLYAVVRDDFTKENKEEALRGGVEFMPVKASDLCVYLTNDMKGGSMMSSNVSLMETVKKQYAFKMKAYIDAFSSLVGIQFIAFLFSLGGGSSSMSTSDGYHFELKFYSADLVIIFTLIWIFVTAITITTKPYRYQDFTFVTNRMSSSLSNILFLLSASLLGAFTAVLSRFLIQAVAYFLLKEDLYVASIMTNEMMIGITVSLLYIFWISSIGYFVGALVQVHKGFALLIPVIVIGSLFYDGFMQRDAMMLTLFQFYFLESSIVLFAIKTLITTAVLFFASIAILNRMEVRR